MSIQNDLEGVDVADHGIENLVFDDQNQERRSWRFCNNVSLPRSEVMFFAQIFLIAFVVTVCSTKLLFFQTSCEESTLWFALLSGAVGFALPNPKI